MRNAIGLLKLISQGEEDIKNGKSKSQEEVFAGIDQTLKERSEEILRGRVVENLRFLKKSPLLPLIGIRWRDQNRKLGGSDQVAD
jgi:hypothetical protein